MQLPHETLGERIAELSAHLNAAKSRLLALIGEFDAGEGWAHQGCDSCAHWLSWKCGVSPAAAREQVRVARALGELPQTRAAFSRGEVSYSKVRALSRVATADSEGYFLMIAEHGTAAHMEKVVRGVRRDRVRRELEGCNEQHETRGLSWQYDDFGMLEVRARLTPEQAARFIRAVESARKNLEPERDDGVSAETYGVAGAPSPSFQASRADALLGLIGGDNPDTEIVVHVSAETLREDAEEGCCQMENGPSLPTESVRRLACDSGVVRLVEGPEGQPLDVGRKTRSIPASLRRALNARDGGCRFPGCDATARVEGHHVRHWAQGGRTALDNLVTLCRHHHRLVHEGGFTVEHRGHGVFRFFRPDAQVLSDTPPRYVVEGCPQQLLVQSNEDHGLRIDNRTGMCRWDGVPMDEAMAVECALRAGGEFEF